MKIIKVLCVEDTRMWEEIEDDKWIPIPGTGIENQCARCGRSHEVHATVDVLGDDGQIGTLIVGTGCMRADETEFAKKITSVLNAQRTLEKNKRLLAKKEALQAEYILIHNAALALTPPRYEIVFENDYKIVFENDVVVGLAATAKPSKRLSVGDVHVWFSLNHPSDRSYLQERIDCAEGFWRQKREDEMGMTVEMRHAYNWVYELKKRVARAEKKIAEFGLQEASRA